MREQAASAACEKGSSPSRVSRAPRPSCHLRRATREQAHSHRAGERAASAAPHASKLRLTAGHKSEPPPPCRARAGHLGRATHEQAPPRCRAPERATSAALRASGLPPPRHAAWTSSSRLGAGALPRLAGQRRAPPRPSAPSAGHDHGLRHQPRFMNWARKQRRVGHMKPKRSMKQCNETIH